VGRGPGPHPVRHLLGESGRAARPQELRRLHAGGAAGGARRHRARHRRARGQRHRLLHRRHAARLHACLDGEAGRPPRGQRHLLHRPY
jgi:hypothetical protein